MSYTSIAQMANNANLRDRLHACYMTQTGTTWANLVDNDGMWRLAASPGWAAAWDSAIVANNPNPGGDALVITDGMILSAVQAYITAWPSNH